MAIDGRRLVQNTNQADKDPYESTGLRVASVLVVVIPAALLVALMFYIGTWTGGWLVGGVGGLVTTALTVLVLWLMRRRKR